MLEQVVSKVMTAIITVRTGLQRIGPVASCALLLAGIYVALRWLLNPTILVFQPALVRPNYAPIFPILLASLATSLVLLAYFASNTARTEAFVAPLRAFLVGDTAYSLGLPIPRLLVLIAIPLLFYGLVPELKRTDLKYPAQMTKNKAVSGEDSLWTIVRASKLDVFKVGSPKPGKMSTAIKVQRFQQQLLIRWTVPLSKLKKSEAEKSTQDELDQQKRLNDLLPEVWISLDQRQHMRPKLPGHKRKSDEYWLLSKSSKSFQARLSDGSARFYWCEELPRGYQRKAVNASIACRLQTNSAGTDSDEFVSLWHGGLLTAAPRGWSTRSGWFLALLYLIELVVMTVATGYVEDESQKFTEQIIPE